ncbi:MAG TPA: methyltransferase domain-containing protein, partial [Vicinamibacteria bacterium]|nr:methyltransferase domain-containing protein [Vicinamibacteria bacterium]
MTDEAVARWVAALATRHSAELTFPEIRRALQALSGLYVERREKIPAGAALKGTGKRAAFALYYGPLHLMLVREIVRALGAAEPPPSRILDLGCGTGVAGAAWALAAGGRPVVDGVDTNGWAVDEAGWTYARLGVKGRAAKGDASRVRLPRPPAGVIAAFAVNELFDAARQALLDQVLEAGRR